MTLSILIPSRNEVFLRQTIADLFANAVTDIEIIAVLDGYWPNPQLMEDPRLHIIHFSEARGMRNAINSAADLSRGEWLMKVDAHCMFAEGFDEVLLKDIDDNQIVVPRRKRLDAENWQIQDVGKPDVDLHYLSNPITNKDGFSMHGCIWPERDRVRLEVPIDETPSFQGSFWMMSRRHFWERLGGMSEEGYGGFTQEPQEIGMKTWLGGGQILVNKKTWYAHLHKGRKYGRGYHQDKYEILRGHEYSARYWMNNRWAGRVHDMEWFVDRFAPMPTWSANWKVDWKRHEFNEHQSVPA
jgi:glycosyltransferase involved in cell wall biosynthesis